MQHKSRAAAQLFCLVVLVGTFGLSIFMVGCPQPFPTPSVSTNSRFPGQVVTIACPESPAEKLLEEYTRGWANSTGAKVHLVRYSQKSGPPEGADVVVCPAGAMPTLASGGSIQPLPESIWSDEGYGWRRLLPVYQNKLLVWDGKPFMVPLLGEALLCFYRSDLLAEAEKKLGQKVSPPSSWEEYLALANLFRAKPELGWSGPTLPPLPSDATELEREFFAITAPFARRAVQESAPLPSEQELFSFHFDLTTMEPRIAQPGFIHGLSLMQAMQKLRPSSDSDQPTDAFAAGTAVLCLADARAIDVFRKSKVASSFGFCPVPGAGLVYPFANGEPETAGQANRVPYLGSASWLAGVSKTCANAEAAFDLLGTLTGPEGSARIVYEPRWGGGATRRDQLERSVSWNGFGLTPALTSDLRDMVEKSLTHPGIRNPVVCLRIPGQVDFQHVLLTEVREALVKGKDAKAALQSASDQWRQRINKGDKKAARRDYYLSLSLQPPG